MGSVESLRTGRARTMVVEFREPPADGLQVAGVEVLSRKGAVWRLAVSGDVNGIVRELARYDLVDLVYERLSLEELFLGFYSGNNGSPIADRGAAEGGDG